MEIEWKLENTQNWDTTVATGSLIQWCKIKCSNCGYTCYVEKYVWDSVSTVFCHRCKTDLRKITEV